MLKLDVNTIVAGIVLAFIGWVGVSIIDLKTDTAVVKVKVDENHKMLTVLWEDFLKEKSNDNFAWFNNPTGEQASAKKEISD